MFRTCRVNRLSNRDFKGLFGDREEKEWIDLAKTIQVMTEALTKKTVPDPSNNGEVKEKKRRKNRTEQKSNKLTTRKRNEKKYISDQNDTELIMHTKNKQINKRNTAATNGKAKNGHSTHYNINKKKQNSNTELQIHTLNKRKIKIRTERKISSKTNKGENDTTPNGNPRMENTNNTRRSKRRKTHQTYGNNTSEWWEMNDDHG